MCPKEWIWKLNAKFVLINQSSITDEIVCDHKSFVSFKKKTPQNTFTYVADYCEDKKESIFVQDFLYFIFQMVLIRHPVIPTC